MDGPTHLAGGGVASQRAAEQQDMRLRPAGKAIEKDRAVESLSLQLS